jgi:hypothetical protein
MAQKIDQQFGEGITGAIPQSLQGNAETAKVL